MKLRFLASVLVFVSAYSPLSVIFAIQDFDYCLLTFGHPKTIALIFSSSVLSCIILWVAVRRTKSSSPPVTILSVSNRSGELVNYSIPYMISFFVSDLGELKQSLSFGFFMLIMYWMTVKTHNIFINPILALMGYNLYDVHYETSEGERQDFFLVHGERLRQNERCRTVELSEQLLLVTDRNPEV